MCKSADLRNVPKGGKMREVGIYVHIPFCKQKCNYCDFVSFANKEDFQEQYMEALLEEINHCESQDLEVNTIYFGGGTPSYLPSHLIIKVLKTIRERFKIQENCEITIEINPGTVDQQKLNDYFQSGFNRISIGLQAVQDHLLETIGRIHTYSAFETCYQEAKKAGFQNINVDLMLGLPTQSVEDLQESVQKVMHLNPTHISLYSLILEKNTVLEKQIKEGVYALPAEEDERKMYHLAKKLLEQRGYIQYEISNFAQKGFESQHNLNCWKQKEYLGFGLAAHSYFQKTRFSNTENLHQYIHNPTESRIIHEKQTEEMQRKEYMLLGFRLLEGISISEFERKFEINPLFYFRFEIAKLVEEDLIEVDLDDIKLTSKGLDYANLVFEEFV